MEENEMGGKRLIENLRRNVESMREGCIEMGIM